MEATTQETAVTRTSATSRTGGPQDRKIEQSKIPNQTIRFFRRQKLFQVISTSEEPQKMDLLLMKLKTARGRQGREARLWPITK
jgi:hypothetical protein